MAKFQLQPGCEIRGLMIRLYPDAETESKLKSLQDDARRGWNWMVKQTDEVIEARKAYALRNGLVGARPQKPDCDGMSPDETKAAWGAYRESCIAWSHAVYDATDRIPCCAWRPKLREEIARFGFKFDYQLLNMLVCSDEDSERQITPGAHFWQALTRNYFSGMAAGGKGRAKGQRRKKFRRASDPMPLQVRSGDCYEFGDFGTRGKGNRPFYDCRIKFNGIRIRGRLPGRAPWGRVLEGVSITKKADGWWASIKQEVPIRKFAEPVPGYVVGIDAGLDNIAAMSDGTIVKNPREKAYSERITGRQAEKKDVGRLQQAAARNVRHLLYNRVVKPLAIAETIRVEKLNGRIGQMGGSVKQSSMRKMVELLQERYGARVQEVDPAFTSQDCSRCGHRSKESWGYDAGPVCTCPTCGMRMHRDVNAAINIAGREPVASGEVVSKVREVLAPIETVNSSNVYDGAAE